MITSEEKNEIHKFLNSKNLPLDLKLEILDHISEQINFKMEVESKDYKTAFSEITDSWKKDLHLTKPFFKAFGKSKILRETICRNNLTIFKKTISHFVIYFAITFFLLFLNKFFAYYFIFYSYILMIGVYIYIIIFNYKTYNSWSKNNQFFISHFQSGTKLFGFASILLLFKLYSFEESSENYFQTIHNLTFSNFLNFKIYLKIIIYNLIFLLWIFGFLRYLQYKKVLNNLKQKINFKL